VRFIGYAHFDRAHTQVSVGDKGEGGRGGGGGGEAVLLLCDAAVMLCDATPML
jgi:hypothetical protein